MKLFKDIEIIDHKDSFYEINIHLNPNVEYRIDTPPPSMEFKREIFPVFPYKTSLDSDNKYFCIADEEISKVIENTITESAQWYSELSDLLPKHYDTREELLRIKSYNLFQIICWYFKRKIDDRRKSS